MINRCIQACAQITCTTKKWREARLKVKNSAKHESWSLPTYSRHTTVHPKIIRTHHTPTSIYSIYKSINQAWQFE
jgi:hypothetical protein